nr:MAG TPA: hypothetical protein [Caudoviricetes sp.]
MRSSKNRTRNAKINRFALEVEGSANNTKDKYK